MTDDRPCPIDGAALPADRYVCRTCTGTLRGLLTDLPGLMGDLETALAKQARFTTQRGGGHFEHPDPDDTRWPETAAVTPLPFAYAASEAGYVARQTILITLDWVTAVRGHPNPPTWAGVSDYLRDAADWLARHPDGPDRIAELIAALRNARAATDRPADRHYIGICGALIDVDLRPIDCPQELYADDHATHVTCPRCGTPWPVADRRTAMRERIEDHHLAAADMERVLAQIGVDVPARLIRLWKHRAEIRAVGVSPKGQPLYRVGDILHRASAS